MSFPDSSSSTSLGPIIGGAVAGIVVIAGAIVGIVIYMKRSRNNKQVQHATTNAQNTTAVFNNIRPPRPSDAIPCETQMTGLSIPRVVDIS